MSETVNLLDPIRSDFLDFSTAWAIQKAGPLEHLRECSSVPKPEQPMAGPAFLCDCGAVILEWKRRCRSQGTEPQKDYDLP